LVWSLRMGADLRRDRQLLPHLWIQ
jgi:hypothetical protein